MPISSANSLQPRFPELVDITTLAELLGVRERYVRRMIQERRVPVVKVGHLVRFDLAQIREWIEEQRRPGRDADGERPYRTEGAGWDDPARVVRRRREVR